MRFFRGRHYLSPLILFIFITSFSSVLSRHRIRHHRDRFKRQQGAHLYLAGSYVYDGGEGPDAGPWTEWSSPSPCSRTCGGGVSTETRQCAPGHTCQGPISRHFSCNTQDCPDFGDFREQQCSEFDNVPFAGVQYQWVPYTKAANPCELNCMPRGERFYYRHREQVVDGTRCNDETPDVCIQGKCQPVGCDMMLGSNAREDLCRVCGGDGSTCNTVRGLLDMQDLQVGYNDILLIPAGATNIKVYEIAPSNNYLAVRNTSGHYYFNGNWRIDFPRPMHIAGCKFHYERSPHGFSAPDTLSCLGPIDEGLFIVLLYQDHNVGVQYEYSLPTNIYPGSKNESYAWTFDQFSPCSQTCGGGIQHRNVTCAGRRTLEPVDTSLCDANNEPASTQKCAEVPCEPQWVPYPWGNCSMPCGEGGTQTREIACQQILANGYPSLVNESECSKLQPKPSVKQPCNVGRLCAKWHIGPWKPCDHLCGEGKQTRQVLCYRNETSKIEIRDDSECTAIETKPQIERKCNIRPCEGVDWITSVWSGCDKCGLTNETRRVKCSTANGVIYPDELCEAALKPPSARQCTTKVACEYLWYASQWSECSAECGQGIQTRSVFCGVVSEDGTVKQVDREKCDKNTTYETSRNCTAEVEKCPGEWFSGPWTECSKPCGGGERGRKVVCLKDLQVVDVANCSPEEIIFSKEACNNQRCSEDNIIPTDVTKYVDESKTEVTSEPTTGETAKPEDEEYEIVIAEKCDDGVWVDEDGSPAELRESPSTDTLGSGTESSATDQFSGTLFSMDELMQSDSPSSSIDDGGTTITGSGDEELTSLASSVSDPSTESSVEGSGDTSDTEPSISTFETDTPIISESSSSLESAPPTGTGTDTTSEDNEPTEGGSEKPTDSSTDLATDLSGSTDFSESPGLTTTSELKSTESIDATVSSVSPQSFGPTESTVSPPSAGSTESPPSTESVESPLPTETTESASKISDNVISTTGVPVKTTTEDVGTGGPIIEPDDSEEETKSTVKTTPPISKPSAETTTPVISTTEGEGISTNETTEFGTTEGAEISTIGGVENRTTEGIEISTTGGVEISTSGGAELSTTEGVENRTTEGAENRTTEGVENRTTEGIEINATGGVEISTSGGAEISTTEGITLSTTGGVEISTTEGVAISTTGGVEMSTTGGLEMSTTGGLEISTTGGLEMSTTGGVEMSTTEGVEMSTTGGEEISTTEGERTSTTKEAEISTTEVSVEITTGSSEGTTEGEVTTTGQTDTTTEGGTESTSQISTTTESTEITQQPTTELSGPTEIMETDIWTTTVKPTITEETTPSSIWETTAAIEIFKTKKPRMCKRKKHKTCEYSKFGCCWDKITPAEGPFDKGCSNPKICKESKFGCCEDGVSPALGENFKGCPSTHCNETLFGCCPDNTTTATGNDNEGCPTPPPACLNSKYGCCDDNVTVAEGPFGEGCEEEETTTYTSYTSSTELYTISTTLEEDCNATTYGCCPDGVQAAEGEFYQGCNITNCKESYFRCCPDGVTPAEGPNYKGCKMPCAQKPYGCCPDGVTPAHGHSGEGCCLVSTYGCCPDNIQPARGPKLEGCGCQYSPYGCCPDQVTAALGHNNEGCGCQYMEHGCCPDQSTPARGLDFEGCPCHTFQFGCCPDGVTAAIGPHQQGCGCRNSEFGCCSDDKTTARGPDFAGCGCESSRFGCCPDGVTPASGDDFEDCENVPKDLQKSCVQPKERGSCRNYTVKWFFDMDYGGCSRFWYGGCDGNDNRFKSKEECDGICVKPEGTDRCKLPKIPGPCEGYYPLWYYDHERRHCAQFIYGGCLGNNNRFESREECMSLCVKDESIDACEQNKEEGPCRGNYLRWYYDKERQVCDQFIYGGCKSNNNNFPTEEACKHQCSQPGRKSDYCSLPRVEGNCTGREPRWYHSISENRCLPFYYSGCNGNKNNFNSREACDADCPKEVEKDLCHLAAETGTCSNYTQRWYFDTREKSCRQFYYGGCGGNGNNFETQQQCAQRCDRTAPAVLPSPSPPPTVPPTEEPFVTDMCFLPSETGNCREAELRFYYDRTDGVCKRFTYGGCEGNRNNFATVEECWQHCGNAQDVCTLPPVVGPCEAAYIQYYYEPRLDSCLSFSYGGCEGNYNRFPDKASCEQRCKRTPDEPIHTQAPPSVEPQTRPPSQVSMCYEEPDPGNCTDSLSVYFYNRETGVCTPFTYSGCGGTSNRFNSEEQCERQCGRFRGQDVCNMPRDPGPCRGYFIKYYYEKSIGRCAQFAYGGCGGTGNRFSSNEECESICVTHEEKRDNVTSTSVCVLPVDTGTCQDGYHTRWYFDNARGECIAFIFSGCGGNLNNFKTFQSCVDFCRDYLVVTDAPPRPQDHPCQAHFDECATLRCPYGIEAYVDDNQCNRCQCQNPCSKVDCPEDSQCAIDINRNRTSNLDPDFIAICRQINKPGQCPSLEQHDQSNCEKECRNDADCPLQLKCCSTGCGTSCVEPLSPPEPPAELVTQTSLPGYTESPIENEYYPPRVNTEEYKPEVTAELGDQATLRCGVIGNPTPSVTWRKENLLIDGTQAKYRIKLDQSLQIITLHKTDAGIYLCTADNRIGEPVTQQIKLDVIEGPQRPASVLEPEEQPNLVVSLNAPATLNCHVLGYPYPAVTWWKDDSLIPLKTAQFEVRKDYSLLIHSVHLSDLGIYTCQAYNGIGKAASWSVIVRARGPYYSRNPEDQKYLKYIVNPPELPTTPTSPTPPPRPPTPPEPPANQVDDRTPPATFIVPVRTNISSESQRFPTNGDFTIQCTVEGYPVPQVDWFKDGVPITQSNRIYVSEHSKLTILQATKADSGTYQCEAANQYYKSTSSITILVDGMYIHPNCRDNRFFANCALIVKARFCSHKYYAKFCCRSCTEAGLLPVDGLHLQSYDKQAALSSNLV